MKKRIGSFFLAIVMLFTLVVPAFAQSITLVVDKDTVKAGEDVTVTVNFDEDLEKVSGLALNLHFNSNLFTYKEGQKFDNYAFIVKGEEGTAPDQYKVINWASLEGVGTIKAGKYVTCTFTAKQDIVDLTTAEFVAKVDMDNTTMAPDCADPTYPDSKISVTVTPAAAEPTGYTVAASAVSTSVTVGDDAQVTLKVANTDAEKYNAYYMEVSYDASVLTYKSINTDASVTDNSGTLKIAGYGSDRTCGTDNIVLTFAGKAVGEAKVTVTSAKVDVKANAAEKDAPVATITTEEATITVGGYQVTLPDAFTGAGTANPGEDYTFTAKDKDKKYDFIGSTMGGSDVTVVDNGNGTYTVKDVTGELKITATALVKINLDNQAGATIDGITNGKYVKPNTAINFTVTPDADKELVVTVNGAEITGMNRQGMYVYTIAADKVTGTELNIVVNYKAADKATIIESGKAWSAINTRNGWDKSGDQVDAGANLSLRIKRETGKTNNDYVVKVNGDVIDIKWKGTLGTAIIPVRYVTAGATVTIDLSYKKATVTVDVSEYLNLSGKTMFLITATGEVADDKVLAYGGNQMYWSAKYNDGKGAYAWLLIDDGTKTLDELKTAAEAAVKVADGTAVKIAYDGDVNLTKTETSAGVDINDAQLVWNMYNAQYSDFKTVNIRKFLEADVNFDKTLDTSDAAAIVNMIVGSSN